MSFYLTQALHRSLQQRPTEIATVFGKRRQTWTQFGDRVARVAGALRELGVRAGERVGILALNSDRYLEYYYAVWWFGGAVNPMQHRWSATEVARSLDDCDTRILVVDDAYTGIVEELRRRSKSLHTVIYVGDTDAPEGMLSWDELLARTDPCEDAYRSGEDLAGVFYTGGTTGFPKAVMLSHTNLCSNAFSGALEFNRPEGGVPLLGAPMCHLAAGALMFGTMVLGYRFVIIATYTPQQVLQAVQSERVTAALLVPAMIQALVDYPSLRDYDTDSLVDVIYGDTPICDSVMMRARAAFPNARFGQAYGMTEMSSVVAVLPAALDTRVSQAAGKVRSSGRATYSAQMRVVDPDDRELPLGSVGELCVRGPGVMQGYWNNPQLTRAVVRNGWMHTGDAAWMDADGFIYVMDRIADVIVTSGHNVYSTEVEGALSQHPAVAAAAVIGVPDRALGQAVHAVVVLRPDRQVSEAALIAHAGKLIDEYKCPRSVEFRTHLPLTEAGKVMKTELRRGRAQPDR
jgi:acyl-CoA synthetase (AMP-forming)/AMP-acid ligase II